MYAAFSLPSRWSPHCLTSFQALCSLYHLLVPAPNPCVESTWPPFSPQERPPRWSIITFPNQNQGDNSSLPMARALPEVLVPTQKHVSSLVANQGQLHNLFTCLFTYSRCIHWAPLEPQLGSELGAGDPHVLKTMCILLFKPQRHDHISVSQDKSHCHVTSSRSDSDTATGGFSAPHSPQKWGHTLITHSSFLFILCENVFFPGSLTN